jgi:CheY-like chemotaxis protein
MIMKRALSLLTAGAGVACMLQTHVEASNRLRGVDDNRRLDLARFVDPKDVVLKTPQDTPEFDPTPVQDMPWVLPLTRIQIPRPINVLAFGGSVTWGATLENRHDAYPWLIGTPYVDHVDNMAMRATGADYPSLCLESIIPDVATKNYDVILFDFVMNGTDGFPLLLKRLRERYPDAIIIYVHIWSLVNMAIDPATGENPRQAKYDPDRDWQWTSVDTFNGHGDSDCGREICSSEEMEKLVTDAGGYVWKMGLPDTPKKAIAAGWFSDDWHHLADKGHRMIAQHMLNLLSTVKHDVFKEKRLGSFGMGDQCYNWFQTGDIQVEYENAHPVDLLATKNVNLGDPDFKKITLEFDPVEGGSIKFHSKFDIPVPVGLAYMSITEPADYQVVDVAVDGAQPVRVDPSINRSYMSSAHITVFSQVGFAHPGENTIQITPVDQRKNPFRAIGIYLCGHCAATGEMGTGAVNTLIQSKALSDVEEKQ